MHNPFRNTILVMLVASTLMLGGCAGGGGGAGYWFHILFVIIPMVAIGVYLLKRTEAMNDSLYILEGQLKRLSSKIDSIEEKVAKNQKPEPKKRTKS